MAGGVFELVCIPSSFHYSIDGVQQMPGSESGNPPDAWTAAICAAVVAEAKQGLTVFDSSTNSITLNNSIHGGAFMTSTRSNLTVTSVLPSNTIIVHGPDNSS